MKPTSSSLYAISALLLVAGCSKEREDPSAGPPTDPASTRFIASPKQADDLLAAFQVMKDKFRSRSDEEPGERPLDEAVWMSEADANEAMADASVNGPERSQGTLEFTLPTHQKQDGSLWVDNADLIGQQETLVSDLAQAAHGKRFYLVDVELASVSEGEAHLTATWEKAEGQDEGGSRDIGPDTPPEPGCWRVTYPGANNDAADVMNNRLFFNHIYPTGTYFINVGAGILVTTNSIYTSGAGGHPIFIGTPIAQGGPGWLVSSYFNTTSTVCFPDYWNKYLAMRAFLVHPPTGTEMIDEAYNGIDWGAPHVSGDPTNPYYPTGQYEHGWGWRYGTPKQPKH